MKAFRLRLFIPLLGAALVGRSEPTLTTFLPALQAHPTLSLAELRAGGVAADVSYLDWGAPRVALQEWIARDPVAPWVSLWKSRATLPDAAWRLLQRELSIMARYHITPQYKMFVTEWEGSVGGFPRDAAEWQKQIDRLPRKLGILTLVASENALDDYATTTNFVWVQNIEAARKAELIDVALKHWAERRGFEEPAAWLTGTGASGVEWNLPATWLAVDCFTTKPDLAVKLLSRVDDPALRQVAILAIASGVADAKSFEPLRSLTDAATWSLVTSR